MQPGRSSAGAEFIKDLRRSAGPLNATDLADRMIRIDLDDGVKHNYEIFKNVLAKIK